MRNATVILIHANDDCRPLEVELGLLNGVLASLGGQSVPLSIASRLQPAPRLAIFHAACCPQWPEALRSLKAMWRDTPLIGILREETISSRSARDALSGDLSDFLCEPVRGAELRARIERWLDLLTSRDEQPDMLAFKARHQLDSLLGDNEVFVQALRRIPLLAASDATVLIHGETGTGKELVARALHYSGRRRNGPFVPCNCGALPDHLFENELFGHAAGAYTDARGEQKGLLAIANGGTLFLDEIDSLSLSGQVKLLRLLQDKEYRPLGSSQLHHADVRIMAATNVKLADLVAKKAFREDLFHRLNVLQLNLPPLRDRLSDVAALAQEFLRRFSSQLNRAGLRFSEGALQALESYQWPGNVRELESVVQRTAILSKSCVIEATDLELPENKGSVVARVAFEQAKRQVIGGFERSYLVRLLSELGGNISRVARQAGKDRRTIQRLLRKYSLVAANYRQ